MLVYTLVLAFLSLFWSPVFTDPNLLQSDREADGFVGPVQSVVVETAKLIPVRIRWQQNFRSQAHIVHWLETPDLVAQFTTAPMQWHEQVVGFVGELHQLLPARTSVFILAPFQFIAIQPQASLALPNVGEPALVAGRVVGTTVVELPVVGQVLLPELSAVAIAPAVPPTNWPEWSEEPRRLWQTTTYDAQGKLRDTAHYTAEGTLRWRWHYTYTAQGRRMERLSTDAAQVPRWTIRYIYDPTGRLQEKTEVAADQSVTRRWHYTYDAQGRLIEEANYDDQNALLWKWRYAYNPQGQRVEESNHTGNGALLWRRLYVYDLHNRLTQESQYNAADTLMWKHAYAYDTHGNRIDETLYKGNGILRGRSRYTYEAYDTYGNWLKRTESKWVEQAGQADFVPTQVLYRTLRYH